MSERETIPAPAPEEKTNPGHEAPPDFVGQPPKIIPGAPDWFNEAMQQLREMTAPIRDLTAKLDHLQIDVDAIRQQQFVYQESNRSRMREYEMDLEDTRREVTSLGRRVSSMERQLKGEDYDRRTRQEAPGSGPIVDS